jgi:ParB-like chromosome segregation protein Spo0J
MTCSTEHSNFPPYKRVEIETLIPYARNSRTHSDQQVAQIAASIREFGFTNPVLVDAEGGIIAGHGRVLAARKLGMGTVPAITLSHLTATQRRAYVIADNKLALNAGWDDAMLSIEIAELADTDFDMPLLGFTDEEMKMIVAGVEALDEMPKLRDGDREPFQQKTFTLHDEQASVVDDAITLARTNPCADTGINENSNGNALALICEEWLAANA